MPKNHLFRVNLTYEYDYYFFIYFYIIISISIESKICPKLYDCNQVISCQAKISPAIKGNQIKKAFILSCSGGNLLVGPYEPCYTH